MLPVVPGNVDLRVTGVGSHRGVVTIPSDATAVEIRNDPSIFTGLGIVGTGIGAGATLAGVLLLVLTSPSGSTSSFLYGCIVVGVPILGLGVASLVVGGMKNSAALEVVRPGGRERLVPLPSQPRLRLIGAGPSFGPGAMSFDIAVAF